MCHWFGYPSNYYDDGDLVGEGWSHVHASNSMCDRCVDDGGSSYPTGLDGVAVVISSLCPNMSLSPCAL